MKRQLLKTNEVAERLSICHSQSFALMRSYVI